MSKKTVPIVEETAKKYLPTRESLVTSLAENLLCREHIILMREPDLNREVGTYVMLRRILYLGQGLEQTATDRDAVAERTPAERSKDRARHLQEHAENPAPFGYNGGVACDALTGPCACGAWH